MSLWPLLAIAALVLAVAALALLMLSRGQVARLYDANEALQARIGTVQEQSRLELLAMGQRVLEAEKQVRRLTDRIESLEAARSPTDRYGQLDPRLAGRGAGKDQAAESAAEAQLRSLLRRPPQPPSKPS